MLEEKTASGRSKGRFISFNSPRPVTGSTDVISQLGAIAKLRRPERSPTYLTVWSLKGSIVLGFIQDDGTSTGASRCEIYVLFYQIKLDDSRDAGGTRRGVVSAKWQDERGFYEQSQGRMGQRTKG